MADLLRELKQRAAEENARFEVRVLNQSFRQRGLAARLASKLVGMRIDLTASDKREPKAVSRDHGREPA